MRKSLGSLFFTASLLAAGCTPASEPSDQGPPVDLSAEEAAARAVVDMWLQMWEEEDIALFDEAFSHDPDMIIFGTDAAEYWVGYESARESIEFQLGVFEDTQGTVRNQVVNVHESGEVGWFTEMMDLEVISGEEQVELTVWFSGVLEKQKGGWKIVQFHASVPVSGQAVAY
jgi:ketosteroid isomerase-like protein